MGIVDADLIEQVNDKFPNLCSMKISGYHLGQGDKTELITDWLNVLNYDKVYISKVFTETEVPGWVLELSHVVYGGTGFFYDKAPCLPYEIEHHMPDYHLYDNWVKDMIAKGRKEDDFIYYTKCSIGRLTKGCFMGCDFCVNKNCTEVKFHAHISEFLDQNRPIIILIDDQYNGYEIFEGFAAWEGLLNEVIATGKHFQFRQGLDVRLLDYKKVKILTNAKYYGDYIFAFDNIEDESIIREKLALWRRHTDKRTKLYTFCGFNKDKKYNEEFWINDLYNLFERIFILAEYDCIAYVMRHADYEQSPHKVIYNEIASMCNQQWALRTMTFRQFCIGRGMGKKYKQYKHDPERYLKDGHKKGLAWRTMEEFERQYPDLSAKYFDKKYTELINFVA